MQICVFQAFFRNEPFNLFELFQRRLSDPSANLTNYSRGGWRSKDGKSRSENEGLDSLISGVAEVEAGDLRDGESNGFLTHRYYEVYERGLRNGHVFIPSMIKRERPF